MPSHSQSSTPWIGRVLDGRYRIVSLLGEGAMGAVFVAEHLTLQKQVALKVVHPDLARNTEAASRFAREAMATSRIDHPNVIAAMDYGTLEDGTAFLAMQLVRGPSLSQLLEGGEALHWARMATIGAQIADALVAARPHAIVHRDLKPENVLLQPLDDGGELVKVLDFGVAKFSRSSVAPPHAKPVQAMTGAGLVVGTAGYMAPEQCVGEGADVRSDLYSLGVILWEGIVGQRLWVGEDLQEVVHKQLGGPAPAVGTAAGDPGIPAALELLIAQLLAERPEHRPDDLAEVRDKLRAVAAESNPDQWRPQTGMRPVTGEGPVDTVGSAAHAAVEPAAQGGLSRGLAALLIFVLLVFALGSVTGFIDTAAIGRRLGWQQSASGLPPELDATFVQLVQAEKRKDRTAAARALLAHAPLQDVPTYVRRMADMQLAKTCKAKRKQLSAIAEIGDPRALPLLHQLAARPRGGCGHRKRQDCLACLRRPLKKVIQAFEAAAQQASTP